MIMKNGAIRTCPIFPREFGLRLEGPNDASLQHLLLRHPLGFRHAVVLKLRPLGDHSIPVAKDFGDRARHTGHWLSDPIVKAAGGHGGHSGCN